MRIVESAAWFKSSRSDGKSACIEVAFPTGGVVPIRDSKIPHRAMLAVGADTWSAFVTGVKAGAFTAVR